MDKSEVLAGFSPLQTELVAALLEKSKDAANIYIGAILTFQTKWNPDRIALTAHGIRELIDKLPTFIDVPLVDEDRQRLNHFADALTVVWNKMIENKRWPGETKPPWNGEIDNDLRRVLYKTECLVVAHKAIRDGRKLQTAKIIQKHNYHPEKLPTFIEESKIKQWNEFRSYFANKAHHSETTEEEFKSYLTHFEDMLLSYLKPRIYERSDEIMKLILEGINNEK